MGFFDKIKGAVNAVTGGAAKVEIEFMPMIAMPGEKIRVKVKATSTGAEVKSQGIFVDLNGMERVKLDRGVATGVDSNVSLSKATYESAIAFAPAFVLAAGETKVFEGTIEIPMAAQPSYAGAYTSHEWNIRGRLEAFGNDPDSGYLQIKIGSKPN